MLNYYSDRLLRLPKTTKALDYNELQQYWEEKISPLFESEEVVQQSLVRLPNDKAFFENLNNELRGRDMAPPGSKLARRPTFNGYQVALDLGVGMLVEDMRSSKLYEGDMATFPVFEANKNSTGTTDDCRYTLREVKPKWLTQAPNAPQDTERCRNCAREALRNKKSDTMKPILCPLNLVKACDFPTEKDSSERVINSFKPALSKTEAAHLTKFLHTTSLPKRLRQAQWENHHETPATDLDRLCLAMTLRDCSLFLKIPTVPDTKTSSFQVVAKLGDLDKKNIVTKKAYWENSDIALLEGNFYQSQDAYTPLIDCQLPHYKGKHLTEDLQKYYRV